MAVKKLWRITPILIVLIVLIGSGIGQVIAETTPVNVATSTQGTGWVTDYGWQSKIFFAVNRYWIFYDAGAGSYGYRTSTDGTTWSGYTALPFVLYSGYSHGVDVGVSGAKVAYVHDTTGLNSDIIYRLGTLQANGTITWDAVEQVCIPAAVNLNVYCPAIYFDVSGYNWISYSNAEAGHFSCFVTKNDNNNGTWVTTAGFPKTIVAEGVADGIPTSQLVPMVGDVMYDLYAKPTTDVTYANGYIYGNIWDGSSWGGEHQVSDNLMPYSMFSITHTGNITDVIYQHWENADADFDYYHAHYDGSNWGVDVEVDTAPTGLEYPNVATDGTDLCTVWASRPTLKHIYYRIYSGGSWGDRVDWYTDANTIYGSADDGQANGVWFGNTDAKYGDDSVMVVYLTGTSSPFQIRFGEIDFPVATTTEIGAWLLRQVLSAVVALIIILLVLQSNNPIAWIFGALLGTSAIMFIQVAI